MDPRHKSLCRMKAYSVSAKLVSLMKETDEVFKELFSRIDFIGSFYDGVKVKEASSFNMNLIMKPPLIYQFIECENSGPGPYVKLNVEDALRTANNAKVSRTLSSWISNGYLLEDKPRHWLESVLARTFQNDSQAIVLPVLNETFNVDYKKNGPAYTIHIDGYPEIDIIFVFTIEFNHDKNRPSYYRKHEEYSYPWNIVSDTVKKDVYGRSSDQWRISFPGTERRLIHNKQKLKYVLRFLKAFRDAQTNIVIPSFFFTNLFLWEVQQMNEGIKNPWFWQKRTGYLFVYMLHKLYEELRRGYLAYYWNENVNLLENHNPEHVKNMMGQLKNIILKINRFLSEDHKSLETYIFNLYN